MHIYVITCVHIYIWSKYKIYKWKSISSIELDMEAHTFNFYTKEAIIKGNFMDTYGYTVEKKKRE